MKKAIVIFVCALTLTFCIPLSSFPAEANSAAPYSIGITESGIVVLDESPVQVKKEVLTFYGPDASRKEEEKSGQYLTAEYTFYNPTDMDVVSRAVFPLGTSRRGSYYEAMENGYGAKTNGEEVPFSYRCSINLGEFRYEEDVKKLNDEYITDEFFTPEMKVYIYRCNLAADREVFISTTFDNTPGQNIMLSANSYSFSEGVTRLGLWTEEDFYFYSFGEPAKALPVFTAYENGSEKKRAEGCSVTVTLERETTFLDVIQEKFDDERFSLIDRYNTVIGEINESFFGYDSEEFGIYGRDFIANAQMDMLVWYEYEITFPKKAETVNTVTAPLIPGASYSFEPTVYTYTYLWSPARTWASFSDLTVNIVTDYYLIDDYTDYNFEKTGNGYTLHLDTLPKEGELEFGLCSSPDPKEKVSGWDVLSWVILGGAILGGLAVFTLIVIVVCSAVSAIKRKNYNKRWQ